MWVQNDFFSNAEKKKIQIKPANPKIVKTQKPKSSKNKKKKNEPKKSTYSKKKKTTYVFWNHCAF